MKIGIYTYDFGWAGGVDFLHMIVKGLLSQKTRKIEIYILIYDPSKSRASFKKQLYIQFGSLIRRSLNVIKNPLKLKNVSRFLKKESTYKNSLPENKDYDFVTNLKEIFSKEIVRFIYYNNNEYKSRIKLLQDLQIEIVLPILNNVFPKESPVPWIGYLFDFVYKYYSHLYTKDFCLECDINYSTTLLYAKTVIVNSKSVKEDIYKFFPYAKSQIFNLPFTPFTNEDIYKEALAKSDIEEKYSVSNPYFIISNQFWLHKSHETAFEALRLLRMHSKNSNVEMVCTGRMKDLSGTDDRKNELFGFIDQLHLSKAIHFVGHIPKIEQLALMLRSVALIQPTQFEGGPGGGSVYTAVANGIPSIVSDIAVNREIENEPLVTFFKALNAEDLAIKMDDALIKKREILPYKTLQEKNVKKLEQLGNILINCIDVSLKPE